MTTVDTCLNCQTKVLDLSLLSPKGLCWHCHEVQKNPTPNFYGYGIVDKNGYPWWEESCVCQDREPMDDQVYNLNDDSDGGPYRVVKLVFEEL